MDDEEFFVDSIKIKTRSIKNAYYTDNEIELAGLVVVAKRKGISYNWKDGNGASAKAPAQT